LIGVIRSFTISPSPAARLNFLEGVVENNRPVRALKLRRSSIARLLPTLRRAAIQLSILLVPFVTIVVTQGQSSPTDPGVRGGAPGAGGELSGLTVQEGKFFDEGQRRFAEIDSVSGTLSGEAGSGLGPRFNLNSCVGCHTQPGAGGTSPSTNPQFTVGTLDGAVNTTPFFVTLHGPVREARFKLNPDQTPDGGVHDLFTITGRIDAQGCTIAQPDFNAAAAANNLIFRIPTPTFGAGLIEEIEDAAIITNQNSNGAAKRALGISGHPNRNGNDGTIARFGWKAQNKSLQLFTGEAYNVEMGVSNEVFQTERDETAGCVFNPTPEDRTNFNLTQPEKLPSDVVMFSHFMRFLAPPVPSADTPGGATSIANGRALFTSTSSTGCALCHTPKLSTASAASAALSNQQVNLFSDLLVHHMGSNLADDIAQGQAGPDEFRTAPLWGLGQRIFFLHDGRTTDLLAVIQAHSSTGSEANSVIANFNALSPSQKQDLLNFLRSL
jgi:CxxC motif-containing protein (DUF1111 family)